jgi:hypothetical protein
MSPKTLSIIDSSWANIRSHKGEVVPYSGDVVRTHKEEGDYYPSILSELESGIDEASDLNLRDYSSNQEIDDQKLDVPPNTPTSLATAVAGNEAGGAPATPGSTRGEIALEKSPADCQDALHQR